MNINAIVAVTKKAAKITYIKLRKHAPELLMAVGGASVIGGTVKACTSTLKVKDIIEEKRELMTEIDESEKNAPKLKDGTNYSPDDAAKDRKIVKATTIFKIVKTCAPAVIMILLGLSCFVSSHAIMKNRLSVMCTAYSALKYNYDILLKDYFSYKHAVRETENGELIDKAITESIEGVNETVKPSPDISGSAVYVFDERSPKWSNSPWRNKMLIEGIIGDLQRDLRANGYVFLNDVNRAFKLPISSEGQYLGWTDKVPESDEYGVISLGPDVEAFIEQVDNGLWDNKPAPSLRFYPNVHGNILAYV